MQCVQSRSRVGAGGSHHDVGVETVVESLAEHAHLPETVVVLELLQLLMGWSESEHAGGVHEICGNPVSILSSLLLMT